MNSNELLTHLQASYPTLEFNLESPKEVGILDICTEEEIQQIPKEVITCVFGGICIWDVYCSDCSRFVESPTYYGISEADGKLILEHNKVSIHGVYDEVMNVNVDKLTRTRKKIK